MRFRYEDLEVWEDGVGLYKLFLPLLGRLPHEERFGLGDQIRRALLSIVLNIAEGTGRPSRLDFRRFIRQAIGSLLEVDAALKLAIRLNILEPRDYEDVGPAIQSLYFKLIALEKSLLRAGAPKQVQR